MVAISVVTAVVLFIVGIYRGTWEYAGSGSSGDAQGMAFSGELGVSGCCFIPIFLCGAVGAFFMLWPARKPPKLSQ